MIAGLGLALALTITGCAASTANPTAPDAPAAPGDQSTPGGQADQGVSEGEFMVDPAFPWPSEFPRPRNIVGEFSAKNPLGEGAVRSIDFTGSKAEAEAYVAALIDAGFEFGLGMPDAIVDDSGESVSWLLSTDTLMGTVSTDNGNDPTPLWTISLLG